MTMTYLNAMAELRKIFHRTRLTPAVNVPAEVVQAIVYPPEAYTAEYLRGIEDAAKATEAYGRRYINDGSPCMYYCQEIAKIIRGIVNQFRAGETTYAIQKCPCRSDICDAWHVWPVAAVQGVRFTEEQARAVASLLNQMNAQRRES